MSSDSAKKALGIFKWIYIIEGVFAFLLGALFFAARNSQELLKVSDQFVSSTNVQLPDGMNLGTLLGMVFVFAAIITFVEAWLFSRAKKDGKKTTLLMVLLVISSISGVYSLITSFSVSKIITLVLAVLSLYAVYVVRKEAK